jgi:XRE family transcriptional regulator, regulator of sulfur utilization
MQDPVEKVVPVARSYEDVVAPLREANSPDLTNFVATVEAHFEAVYDLTFGLGEALAARRAELHLSQVQLAERAGVPQADISRIERGKGNPTLGTIGKILDVLQLQLDVRPTH